MRLELDSTEKCTNYLEREYDAEATIPYQMVSVAVANILSP